MSPKVLEEPIQKLMELIEIPDNKSNYLRSQDRKDALENWIAKYLVRVENSQSVLPTFKVDSETHDFICETVALGCVDKLIEERAFDFAINKTHYSTEIIALKIPRVEKIVKKP